MVYFMGKPHTKSYMKKVKLNNRLTLDLSIVEQAFGVPLLLIGDLLFSISEHGTIGVPGGVRSLK